MMTINYSVKAIRNSIAEIYKNLNNDYEELFENGNYDAIAYDVGYINSLCNILGKHKLGCQIYNKFMKR